jgi:hypothetical protein
VQCHGHRQTAVIAAAFVAKEAPVLKFVTLFATLVAVGAFASHAEAHPHASDAFGSRSFFRDPGRSLHESHCEKQRREMMEAEFARENALRQAQIQAQQAAQAVAAKRARLAALQQQKAFAAKRAAAAAARRAATATNARTQATTAIASASAKKDSERTAPPAAAATTIASVEQPVSTPRPTKAISETCRKFSAAADGLIDVPCN